MTRNPKRAAIDSEDAKTALDRLLDRVENGEAVIITRDGVPIARLVPYQEPIDVALVDRAINEVDKLRKGIKLRGVTVRELIDEGRRM